MKLIGSYQPVVDRVLPVPSYQPEVDRILPEWNWYDPTRMKLIRSYQNEVDRVLPECERQSEWLLLFCCKCRDFKSCAGQIACESSEPLQTERARMTQLRGVVFRVASDKTWGQRCASLTPVRRPSRCRSGWQQRDGTCLVRRSRQLCSLWRTNNNNGRNGPVPTLSKSQFSPKITTQKPSTRVNLQLHNLQPQLKSPNNHHMRHS